jgi:hypothetical protein
MKQGQEASQRCKSNYSLELTASSARSYLAPASGSISGLALGPPGMAGKS